MSLYTRFELENYLKNTLGLSDEIVRAFLNHYDQAFTMAEELLINQWN